MFRRHASRASVLVLACLALAALDASGAAAQRRPPAAHDALRARIAELRASRPAGITESTLLSIEYLLDIAARIEPNFSTQSATWTRRAQRFLELAQQGRDPYLEEGRGEILNRGYDPSFSPARQGYAVYIPPNYDPQRAYPMLIMMHGGSSLGNLFLGVVLGNNMDWLTYDQHLWDDYQPRWSPDMIVVAPDGVGQPIWRWMGEQDVLEVIADVQRNYNVDPNRVVLGGLSNGGMGAYQIGTRHAWRFSHVQAIAGAPSWLQYSGGRPTDVERTAMLRSSGMHLIENTTNTDFRYYHGTRDPGPMRPAFVRELTERMRGLGLEPRERWFDFGHDLLYLVHRHGRVYEELARYERNPRPPRVLIVTGDYRANRQHWVVVSRIERYPDLARVDARAESGVLRVTTDNVLEVTFDISNCPLGNGPNARVEIDGAPVFDGPRAQLGSTAVVSRGADGAWRLGALPPPAQGFEKVPNLSGPITDAYFDEIVHVYGTRNAANVATLRDTATRGANGWPSGVWHLQQRVIPDTEVTDELMRTRHLALYGTPGDNAVLDRIASQLPIRVENGAVVFSSGQRFAGAEIGATFIHPNPLAPQRYVLVHTGTQASAISRTRNLPDFLPDYVVFDRQTTSTRPRLIQGRNRQLAAGYFDRFWRLEDARRAGGDEHDDDEAAARGRRVRGRSLPPGITPERMRELAVAVGAPPNFVLPAAVLQQTPPPELEPGPVPPAPPAPTRFAAPSGDPNGPVARTIGRAVPGFYNYRAIIPGGVWRTSPQAVWQIRSERECLRALRDARVPFERYTEPLDTPTPTPVRITGPIGGISYTSNRASHPVVISCELASRLPRFSELLRVEGVTRVLVMSSHRTQPSVSFHRMGMALDIAAFDTPQGRLVVNDHFVETPAARTCEAPAPADWRAAALLRIACALGASDLFSSVLTPNYNDGHRNHFHVDVRPDDPRVFVR